MLILILFFLINFIKSIKVKMETIIKKINNPIINAP